MRFIFFLCVIEAALLAAVTTASRLRPREADTRLAVRDRIAAAGTAARPIEMQRARAAIVTAFLSVQRTFERRLSPEDRAAALDPALLDAILRMEGMFDPTRVGMFGPALRMRIRPGTAFMSNVFGDRWARISLDPNLHARVDYLAKAWLMPPARDCAAVWMFRSDDTALMLDNLTPGECRRLRAERDSQDPGRWTPIVQGASGLPAFVAPYPGNRLAPAAMRAMQAAHVLAVTQRLWLERPGVFRTGFPAAATARAQAVTPADGAGPSHDQ